MEQFENKVLYIESEEMWGEVETFLNSKGYFIAGSLNKDCEWNYLYFHTPSNTFCLCSKFHSDEEINFEEFKNLLEDRKPKVFTEQEVKDILISISPDKTELSEYPKNGTDIDKVEWGILKASVHHTEVINNYIEKHL